jgi:anti-sigma factor RsiW
MSKPPPLTDAERADLVAYLDGELAGDARRAIEARINVDPLWRAEAASLKRAWDLLDYLPQPEPSPNFTQRTLSKLEPIRRPDRRKPDRFEPDRRLLRWVGLGGGWAAAALLAAMIGYQLYPRGGPQGPGERELIRDLRVIENKHFYDQVPDLDFLRGLDQPELFGEESRGG